MSNSGVVGGRNQEDTGQSSREHTGEFLGLCPLDGYVHISMSHWRWPLLRCLALLLSSWTSLGHPSSGPSASLGEGLVAREDTAG